MYTSHHDHQRRPTGDADRLGGVRATRGGGDLGDLTGDRDTLRDTTRVRLPERE